MKGAWIYSSAGPGALLALSALLFLLLVPAPGVQAQDEQRSDEIAQAAGAFAQAWAKADMELLGEAFPASGIRLQLQGPPRADVPRRQAVAALRDFLRGHEDAEVEVTRATSVGGTSDRALMEFVWSATVSGTSHSVRHVVFAGLVRSGDAWLINELRIVR